MLINVLIPSLFSLKIRLRLLLTFFLGLISLQLFASRIDPPKESLPQLMVLLRQTQPDTSRIVVQLKLGRYYLFKPGSYKKDMDSTIHYFNEALALSNKLHSDVWRCKTQLLIGNYEYENGNQPKGVAIVRQVIAWYHQHNDLLSEAQTWFFLGQLLDDGTNYYTPVERSCLLQAVAVYTRCRHNIDAFSLLFNVANMDLITGKLDTAEKEFLSGIDGCKGMPDKNLIHYFEDGIGSLYIIKGQYHKALYYELKLIAELPLKKDEQEAMYWSQTSVTYSYLGMNDKALFCDNKALEILNTITPGNYNFFYAVNNTVKNLLALKRPAEALSIVDHAVHRLKPDGVLEKTYAYRDFAQCYAALKQNKLADKYFDIMAHTYDGGYLKQRLNSAAMDSYIINLSIAIDYFINVSQYKKAAYYFKKIEPYYEGMFVATKTRVLPLEIKLDSASGNYKKAFHDLSIYKRISDSVYNSTKSRQIAEIQTEYETTQKERSIKLLQSQGKAQQLELQTANLERNFTLGGVVLLVMLTGLAYNRYRFKQKTNEVLEAKQREINFKNESLQNLLSDKDQLITEKDWLIKEVHHRVKNNLQTVLSLLESQASFLKDDALTAIRTSQHRIYAMSLIHQKLYQDDQITTIDIALYLQEFIESLKESFGTDGTIKFNLDLQPINMSASQAIPLALIVNEAVTNAIKYAFPDWGDGVILIKIKENMGQIELVITDNGVGIDPALVNMELDSMGLALMKGLTTELKGKLEILNVGGTTVNVIFNHDNLLNWPEGIQSLHT